MTSGNWMDKKIVSDDVIRSHINEFIRDEIQETINDFVDAQDSTKGLGFVSPDDEQELKSTSLIKKLINL